VVTQQPDGSYRIEVWTHSEDLVTDLDIPFATAVEELIEDVLGQREPGPPSAPDRVGSPPRPPAGPVPGTGSRRPRDPE
jgi:hypothetical protein